MFTWFLPKSVSFSETQRELTAFVHFLELDVGAAVPEITFPVRLDFLPAIGAFERAVFVYQGTKVFI